MKMAKPVTGPDHVLFYFLRLQTTQFCGLATVTEFVLAVGSREMAALPHWRQFAEPNSQALVLSVSSRPTSHLWLPTAPQTLAPIAHEIAVSPCTVGTSNCPLSN